MNIAIVGAGIGGLATANALLKQGFNVQVYERARVLRPIGAGLSLTPNGLNSLNAIQPGIAESLIKAGSITQTLTLKRSTGETIALKPITTMQRYGQPMLNIQWSKLQTILADALPSNIVHLQHHCVGFQQQDNSIEVFFADGKTVRADLLIGADGVNSIVRQQLIGDGMPTYAGRMSWRAVIQYSHKQLPPNTATLMTALDDKFILLIDVGNGCIFWSAGMLQEDDSVCEQASDVKARVLELFVGWGEPVEAIIEATPDKDIVERPIQDRSPLEHWSKGSVTLMGDAAHPVVPSLGQGANTAFEDAYELAECLAAAPNLSTALHDYETSRIPRTTVIYHRSASEGRNSYGTASESTFAKLMKTSEMSQDDFEAWLYSYNPATPN